MNESVSIFRTQFRSSHEQTHHGTAHTNTHAQSMRLKCQVQNYWTISICSILSDSSCMQHIVSHETLVFLFGLVHTKKNVSLLFSRYSRHSWSNLRSINVVIQLKCELKHSTNHIWIFAFDIERIFGRLAINKSDGDALSIQHFDLVCRTTITV